MFRAGQCSASGARWASGNSHSARARCLGLCAQDFRREHAVDLEKLELDRVAARIGRGIDKGQGARQVAAVIAGGFGDEKRLRFHLTISKERMAKKRLTGAPYEYADLECVMNRIAAESCAMACHDGPRIAQAQRP